MTVRPRPVGPAARPEFSRAQRTAVSALLEGDPLPVVTAQLLSRLDRNAPIGPYR